MIPLDLLYGLLAGMLSCLTPETWILLPLLPAAIVAARRAGIIALLVGLGLSLIVTGMLAGSFGIGFAIEAKWPRWLVCALLVVQGLALMSPAVVERFPLLTGGSFYGIREESSLAEAFRLFLLALLLGVNWIPRVGPVLGKASLMAAYIQSSGLALPVLFMFGVGAAVPWIVVGRFLRLVLRPVAWQAIDGMAGKRLLGLTLIVVAVIGGTGLEIPLVHRINAVLPDWMGHQASRF